MLVGALHIIVFAGCFYLLGQNQLHFDALKATDEIPYLTQSDSIWYIYMMILGNGETGSFDLGKASESTNLYIVFTFATFVLLIHLLNMLIAIMGETFGARAAVGEQIRVKDNLQFVMDNWHLMDFALNYKTDQVKYIMAAFSATEEDKEVEVINQLRADLEQKIQNNHFEVKESQNEMMKILKEIQSVQKEQQSAPNQMVQVSEKGE